MARSVFARLGVRRATGLGISIVVAPITLAFCTSPNDTLADVPTADGPWPVEVLPCNEVIPGMSSVEGREEACAFGELPTGDDARYDVVKAQVEAFVDVTINDTVCANFEPGTYTCVFYVKASDDEWESLVVYLVSEDSADGGAAGRHIAYFSPGQSPDDGRDAVAGAGLGELP